MRILLTGASSFTGYWFARELAGAGHEVVAPLLRPLDAYTGLRGQRVQGLRSLVERVPDCAFGHPRFMDLLGRDFDLLAHHGAQVGDYRSPWFDAVGAVSANTYNLRAILASGRIGAMVLTSSVFAPGEGAGTAPLSAFSPYGLSKGMTNDLVKFLADEAGIPLGRFVIPNPFGPFEEPRFCAYLMQTWKQGGIATVKTPAYVRDNIHVDLLARAYVQYATHLLAGVALPAFLPSGYVGSQGEFAQRFAREMRSRLGLACTLELVEQTEFSEPLMRVNTQPAAVYVPQWNEQQAWDGLAEYHA